MGRSCISLEALSEGPLTSSLLILRVVNRKPKAKDPPFPWMIEVKTADEIECECPQAS